MAGMHPTHSTSLSSNGPLTDSSVLIESPMDPSGTMKATPASSRPTVANTVPVTPVLEPNVNGMVPMSAIIHRMSNEAFSDLSNLSEILPSMDDAQRKLHILEYALSKREQFIKLLVLTKWAKSAPKIQQCQNIVGFLHNQNEQFTHAVGGLFETYKTFGRARVRNYDIPTAIDVLTTGTYQRLPSRIKQVYVAEEKPTKAEMASTLDRLDDVIRMRLLCDELVPPAMKYTVGKGKAKFVVANEFEVTLTVPGPGTPEDVPWRIIGLKILVKPVGGSFQGLETTLNEAQMKGIMMMAQKELESSSTSSAPPSLPATGAESKGPANQALLRLYDYLHMLSLHLLIELVYIQAFHLLRSGWTDRLRVEINQSRSIVRLVYWHNGYTPPTLPPPTLTPKRRASTTPASAAATAKETSSAASAQHEHFLEIRIEESVGPVSKIPDGLAGALVDPKILGYPKASMKVVWSQVAKGIVSENETRAILELDPSNLNIERLLLRAVNMHTSQAMQGFYDRLRSHIASIKSQPEHQDGTRFLPEDVRLESAVADESQTALASRALTDSQTLLVRLKGDRWIRIRIDVRTGRVVVREVGKTGEGNDPVIAAFQARLNENANNIVDALVSLRFSMAIVELESTGALLGLQPYRRIALGKADTAQFGVNIQQILFLQYPQHPRHYLVLGVVDQRFRVWLIEVAPAEREIAGIWLTLKSIMPIYWQGLKRQQSAPEVDVNLKKLSAKRKSVQFDVEDDVSGDFTDIDELTIDQDVLSKLESLGRVRICHNEAREQLQVHGIRYHYLSAASLRVKPGENSEMSRVANMVPLLRLDPSTICKGSADGLFLYVGAKLTGWWDSQRGTCNFVIQAKFAPGVTLPIMESELLGSSVVFSAKTDLLSFNYKTRGAFVGQFKEDWERIVRMLKVIRQLHAPTLPNSSIMLRVCHLHKVQLQYCGQYLLTIQWMPAQTSDQKSSTGVIISKAPRFKQGFYEIDLSEADSDSGITVNPHRRMRYFLQDMFNREADLHSLMNTVIQTCPILEVLDRLENNVKEDSMGMKMLSVVPRSAHHIRVIVGSKFALDIRAYSRTHLSMFDASFPTESFGSDLPPPPIPTTAPALLATPGRVLPPTTRGRLQYGPISNLLGVIGGIDVNKEDEEFNRLQLGAPSTHNDTDGSMEITMEQPKLESEQTPNQHSPLTPPSTPRDQEYEVMALQNGLICSRNISGRVLYRLAKHMENLA
ncbi:mediator of RNA polymerase II transcription subunit 14 [Entomortierella parvispora]|uniref:Mediator of RNA polymerase II transcription subunit 14 n=1 Tax=Entomortierella parvispora TaxID=205924 RepID=A0A9P3HFS4_9FUNG|nr:mediator of RNA polymerase II transcription subunit 14 [Entomortierella parvispora]